MVGASGTVSPDGRPARRRRAAFAASVLLHLGVAWLVQRAVPDRRLDARRAAPPATPVSITIIESPAPRRENEQLAGAPSDRSRPRPKRPTTQPREVPPPETTAPVPPPKVDLSLSSLPNGTKERVANPVGDEGIERLLTPAPDQAGRRPTIDQLRVVAERRAAAIENVRVGRTDPLHFDYLRGARDLLAPEATRIAERLPLGPAETVKGWTRGYLGRVAEVNRGTARDLPESPTDDPFGPRPDVLGQYREMERQAASGAAERTAQVCLGVAPNHAVVVTLGRSSGNAALDSLAVESFRASAGARPVAPEIRPGLACYLVRIRAYRVPPSPSLSFTWNHGPKVIYPLKRMTEVSVQLESVDYGARASQGPSR